MLLTRREEPGACRAAAHGRSARPGILWWLVALPVLGTVAMAGLGMLLGNLGAGIGMTISLAPLFVIGVKLLRR